MDNIKFLKRTDNTQKVYLSENTLNVVDILKNNYSYIYNSINEEGFILKSTECNLFKEIVFDFKVVGFCSYDFSREFITAALNNIYILPQFRGNKLFLKELKKTMIEHNKPSIVEPTRFVVELLIKYGFAKKITDNIVASAIEFIVPGEHVMSNIQYDNREELSTHFYDLNICSCIHFLDLNKNLIAYSAPLNYDIINYDCLEYRQKINDGYFNEMKEIFLSHEPELIMILLDLEEKLPTKSYTLEEVIGGEDNLSMYIESLIDDAHVTYEKALSIKNQIKEEYDAGMILNESLLIRLAYLFEVNPKPTIKSHSEKCPYCYMPIDNHDKFCHFCGINLDYNPDEMFNSLISSFNDSNSDFKEDIRYIVFKFLKLIDNSIDFNYSIITIENTYNCQWDELESFLNKYDLLTPDNLVSKNGYDFLYNHPLYYYEKYGMDIINYNDFERFFFKNFNSNGDKICLEYLMQLDEDKYVLEIIEDIKNNLK